jgi:hypothetical protein
MENFGFYFSWGWTHIISWDALDHLLFLLALTAMYTFQDRKKLLILITAFTIGHSLTLALSIAQIIQVNARWIEFFIPLTIVCSGIFNFFSSKTYGWIKNGKYLLTLIFGLIHGLGFASVIRMTLMESENIGLPLLYFNLGIEAGQVVVVMIIVLLTEIAIRTLGISKKWWTAILSVLAILGGLYFAFIRSPF